MALDRPAPNAAQKAGETTWLVASHNAGKIREIRALLEPRGIAVTSAAQKKLPVPDETGTTFAANATIKAEAAANATGLPALSDDSGLEVRALGGAPGVVSADWAGEPRDFGAAMDRVEREWRAAGAGDPSAAFVCALALARPGRETVVYEGRIEGALTFPRRGDRGFGYDPIFIPGGETETFGEMDPARKHAMSHRARAFAALVAGEFGA